MWCIQWHGMWGCWGEGVMAHDLVETAICTKFIQTSKQKAVSTMGTTNNVTNFNGKHAVVPL